MERIDWTLLVIDAAGSHGIDPVQLQKCLFLLGRNCPQIPAENYYHFQPYNYGPFDITIYQDAEMLQRQGFVSIQKTAWRKWAEYFVTPQGKERAQALKTNEVGPEVSGYLQRLVDWARGLSFEELIKTIYAHYPEFRANSVFRD